METVRYEDPAGAFEVHLPEGWEAGPDDEGGLSISRVDGQGLLHLIPFADESAEEIDPAEQLYAFLEEQEIEIEEDEVEDLELPGDRSAALCEYVADDEEEVYWIVAVAAGPGQLVFAHYSCPAGQEKVERVAVRAILTSLTF